MRQVRPLWFYALTVSAIFLIGLMLCGLAAAEQPEPQHYSQIKLSKTSATISPLTRGASLRVTNQKPGYEPIVWSSSDESVATVDPDTGVIEPRCDNGRTVISATGSLSGKYARCALVVRTNAVKSIKLSARSLSISPGGSYQFKYTLSPANATYQSLNWSIQSQNPPEDPAAQSRVDPETGLFRAGLMEGEQLTLTATAHNGARATCTVRVMHIPVSSVKFSRSSGSIPIGRALDLNKYLTVLPKTAGDLSVTWSSSNEAVARVDQDGMVTFIAEGKAKITATSNQNPQKRASIALSGQVVRVKTLALSGGLAVCDPGESFTLSAQVSPNTATFPEVSWSSGNESVATVDERGNVSVRAAGVAVITATTDNGRKSASFSVHARGGDMRTVKISAVGDMVIGGDVKKVKKADSSFGDGLTSYRRFQKYFLERGAEYFFSGVRDILQSDDITVANFEGTLTNTKNPQNKTFAFRGSPEYRYLVANGGVDVACLANNHSMDYQAQGYQDTVRYLRSVGVSTFGNGSGTVAVREAQGVRVGFAGFNVPTSRSAISNAISNLKKSKRCDIVVVSFHWSHSKEWQSKVANQERSLARCAIDKGADLVLGHHKHVVSGIEQYKGKMIAYDLGNFVALIRNAIDGVYTDKDSMIFQQKFNVFSDGYVECADPSIIPVMISDAQDVLTGNPRPVSGEDAERVLSKIKNRTAAKDLPLVKTIPGY